MLEKDLYAWDKVIKTARTSFINIENIQHRFEDAWKNLDNLEKSLKDDNDQPATKKKDKKRKGKRKGMGSKKKRGTGRK